jgi:glycosyltransferase involved in cell wall biosynthesis
MLSPCTVMASPIPGHTTMADRLSSFSGARNDRGIVVLYTTLVHYFVAVIEEIAAIDPDSSIDVIHYDRATANSTRYTVPEHKTVNYFGRSNFDKNSLYNFLKERMPDIIYVSGWSDGEYVSAIRRFKKISPHTSVVAGIDDQWFGNIRQRVGQLIFPFIYKRLFDFFWVSGKPQYGYALHFGYGSTSIISNLLTHDPSVAQPLPSFTRRFVFVGRFVKEKGLDLLIDAYARLPAHVRGEWPLVLVGDGPMKKEIEERAVAGVELRGFLQLPELLEELSIGGVGCIASVAEQWGVAIHEMSAMGFPLILSSSCGAATEFLIPGYNGFLFRNSDLESLYRALEQMTKLGDTELKSFSDRSVTLSKRITASHSAYSLISVRLLRAM